MPPPSSLEPGTPIPENETRPDHAAPDSKGPVSFVPHDATGAVQNEPVRIRTNRYGDLEEHELVHLLDTIEDERAKARFRESIYISLFVWMAIAWVVLYGPRYLWHAPRLINPADVLKQRELTQLTMPTLPHVSTPAPKIDNKTMEHLKEAARNAPKAPEAPKPATPPPPTPTPATPMASSTPVIPPPTAPTPNIRNTPPPVADAPTPQPTTHPNFNTSSTAGDTIRDALNNAAKNRGGSGGDYHDRSNSPLKTGGVDILSERHPGDGLDPYIQRILADIKRNWIPLIPEEARPPLRAQGETYIRFTIMPDGNIAVGGMHLDGSTHDDAINRSCWNAITSEGQYPPLPSTFHEPNLELRIHFLVNREPQ